MVDIWTPVTVSCLGWISALPFAQVKASTSSLSSSLRYSFSYSSNSDPYQQVFDIAFAESSSSISFLLPPGTLTVYASVFESLTPDAVAVTEIQVADRSVLVFSFTGLP